MLVGQFFSLLCSGHEMIYMIKLGVHSTVNIIRGKMKMTPLLKIFTFFCHVCNA